MIQRKQTLFLLQVAFLSLSLLFVPSLSLEWNSAHDLNVALIPINSQDYSSTMGHFAAIGLNVLGLILSFITIFLFKKRELQVKLCYVLLIIYLVLPFMIAFCPFAVSTVGKEFATYHSPFSYIICGVSVIASYLAARFIKKDIELLKSADRIR